MSNSNNSIEEIIWSDLDESNSFPANRPLLAHYTSVKNIESIISGRELWLSNPLLMNDFEELKFGVLQGAKAFRESLPLRKACEARNCYGTLIEAFDEFIAQLDSHDAIDIYIFCFSLHDANDRDGRLSMWRGYGNNGGGATIVFDTSQVEPAENSPLMISPVIYASTEARLKWITKKIEQLTEIVSDQSFDPAYARELAWHFFARVLIYSLHTKHEGFSEEREWRLVYVGMFDQAGLGKSMLSYHISDRGIEPKLKLKLSTPSELTAKTFKLEEVIDRIILGPTAASPLSKSAFIRMLESHEMKHLGDKVFPSTTPYRTN